MNKITLFAALLLIPAGRALAASPEKALSLVHYGNIMSHEGNDVIMVKEFYMAYGDPSYQSELANTPGRSGRKGSSGMNAARYYPNGDGTWRIYNFRLPSEENTKEGLAQRDLYREYLDRPDVKAVMDDSEARTDFGQPGEFIYKRMRLSSSDLPAPLNRLSAQSLALMENILRYNEDGTMKVYFWKPFDRDGKAQQLLQRIKRELTGEFF